MKVLLDHCVPRRFRHLLTGHEVGTVFEMGELLHQPIKLVGARNWIGDGALAVDEDW